MIVPSRSMATRTVRKVMNEILDQYLVDNPDQNVINVSKSRVFSEEISAELNELL